MSETQKKEVNISELNLDSSNSKNEKISGLDGSGDHVPSSSNDNIDVISKIPEESVKEQSPEKSVHAELVHEVNLGDGDNKPDSLCAKIEADTTIGDEVGEKKVVDEETTDVPKDDETESQEDEMVLKWDDEDDDGELLDEANDPETKENETLVTTEVKNEQEILNALESQIANVDSESNKTSDENLSTKNNCKEEMIDLIANIDNLIDVKPTTEDMTDNTHHSIDEYSKNKANDIEIEENPPVGKIEETAADKLEETTTDKIEETAEIKHDEMDIDPKPVENIIEESKSTIQKLNTDVNLKLDEKPATKMSEAEESISINVKSTKELDVKDNHTNEDSDILQMDIIANSTEIIDDINETLHTTNNSMVENESTIIQPREHGINQLDAMTEIPTQELIDIIDDSMELPAEDIPDDQNMSVDIDANPEVDETNTEEPESSKTIAEVENTVNQIDTEIIDLESNLKQLEEQDEINDNKIEGDSKNVTTENNSQKNTPKVKVSTSVSCLEVDNKLIEHDTQEDNSLKAANMSTTDTQSPKLKLIPLSQLMKASAQEYLESDSELNTSDLKDAAKSENTDTKTLDNKNSAEADISSDKAIESNKIEATTGQSISDTDGDKIEVSSPDADAKSIPKETSENAESETLQSQQGNTENTNDFDKSSTPQTVLMDDQDGAAEVTDSLGLLAESSRVRDDDEEQEQETSEHDEDDDDFEQDDESSNQMLIDNSEDSAQLSENEVPRVPTVGTLDKDDNAQDFVEKSPEEDGFEFEISNVIEAEKEVEIDDDIVCEEVEIAATIPEDTSEIQIEEESLQVAPEIKNIETELKKATDEYTAEDSRLRALLLRPITESTTIPDEKKEKAEKVDDSKQSTSKLMKLEICSPDQIVNIVDLEESSSEDDIQEVQKPDVQADVTSVNIAADVEVMSSGENTSEISNKEGETVITVPKPPKQKPARLNTSEISIKTTTASETAPLVIPEAKLAEGKAGEVFNLDSDDEETAGLPSSPRKSPAKDQPVKKCLNHACTSGPSVRYLRADLSTLSYFDSAKKRAMVCEFCAFQVAQRSKSLIEGVKSLAPLLELGAGRDKQPLVEILDSESDDEADDEKQADMIIGDKAEELQSQLENMLNETWVKYMMDDRLKSAEDQLSKDIEKLEMESAEVSALLSACQAATDALRSSLYATFEGDRVHMTPLVIVDTPGNMFSFLEPQNEEKGEKRPASTTEAELPAKRPVLDTGILTKSMDTDDIQESSQSPDKMEDDKEVCVVNLSAEAAPASLPPPGELTREPLRAGAAVYAARNAYGSWLKARVVELMPRVNAFTSCRVRFEVRSSRSITKILPARCLAYPQPAPVRMTIGTRVIALFKDISDVAGVVKRQSFYSGIVAEIPNPVNKYRYLVFFDDGYAQYVHHSDTRLVCEFSNLVWEEVHPFSRDFVREYLLAYPERPMVRLHTGQCLKTEWNGKWWVSRVVQVDASLVRVYFEQDKRYEWIYRGSTRLAPLYLEKQAAGKARARPMPRNTASNLPYVEYTRSEEPETTRVREAAESDAQIMKAHQQEELRRQRAVAKKSTVTTVPPPPQPLPTANLDTVTSRVVYYTPKNAIRPHKMVAHGCGPPCRRTDVLALRDLRTYNPLAKPLLSGWERQIVRYKGHKEVMYRAPCGRRLRNMDELHKYLTAVNSDMGVELFDFGANTHCLAEFVLNKCRVGKKDLSHGKENVPVPCVNYYDDSLPEFCSYNTERTPTAGVPLNLDPDFLCGCDCTDDCQDKSKCACWRMTLEGAHTIGLAGDNIGYVYKRLPEPLPSGIYECNVRCKCKSTCLNRVAQHPLQLKLQVFKTLNRGWGIRALNDVPKGSFLCIYAGNLLTDATANLDGLNEGDEYLAELDYIEVVEAMKEGFEDDVPEQDKIQDKETESEEESSEPESEEERPKDEARDGDFEPKYLPPTTHAFSKRLRKRIKAKKETRYEEQRKIERDANKDDDDCITISDDEELREPARFAAQAGMGGAISSKYRSVRTYFGKDEACYIMDAKVQGNIGRYLNHSCSPNVFVQNVFVDTHDPRFPWVAFFALTHIRAGTELTWNYNYDVGSVPGKALYCYCGSMNCRGRLL